MINSAEEIAKLKENALDKIYTILKTVEFTIAQYAEIIQAIERIKNTTTKPNVEEEN